MSQALHILPLVDEGADVLKDIAEFLADPNGDLDAAKAATLAATIHPGDPTKAQAFVNLLVTGWPKQKNLLQQTTLAVGV